MLLDLLVRHPVAHTGKQLVQVMPGLGREGGKEGGEGRGGVRDFRLVRHAVTHTGEELVQMVPRLKRRGGREGRREGGREGE